MRNFALSLSIFLIFGLSGSVSMTMYGGGAGAGLSASYAQGHSDQDYVRNTNSNLFANNVNIYVRDDANLNGVMLNAEDTLSMYVGGNLDLTSVRDSYSSNSAGESYGGGLSLSGEGLTGVGTSKDSSRSNYQEKQTILSSITGNNVNIDVSGNTNMKGSLISTGNWNDNGNFVDNGQLYLSTETLTYASLSNTMYSESKAIHSDSQYVFSNGLGASEIGELANGATNTIVSIGNIADNGVTTVWNNGKNTYDTFQKGTGFEGSSSYGYARDNGYSSKKVASTIGQGNLIVGDTANSDDMSRLNRDTVNINKYLYSGSTEVTIPTFNYSAIINSIGSEAKSGFSHFNGEKNLLQDILYPSISDIEKYRLKNDMRNNILKINQE